MDNKLGVPKTSTMASETTIAGTPNIVDKEAQDPLKDGSLSDHHDSHAHPLAQLSSARKHFLLVIFAISTFVDVCNVSGVAIAVAQIGMDIDLGISQLVWVSEKMPAWFQKYFPRWQNADFTVSPISSILQSFLFALCRHQPS
jgi:hypothetical protein